MNIDYAALRFYFDVLVAAGLFANFWWAIMDRKNRATADQLASHKAATADSLNQHSQRLSGIEAKIESIPSHSDLAKVYESVNALSATVNQLVGENRGQTDILRMLLRKQEG
jgi:hypothetical protein